MGADVPAEVQEPARLAAVARSGLADAVASSPSFQRLVDLAAELVDAPLGFFTMVDADTSWYLAATGMPADVASGPVEASFCKYVIASGEGLFVDEARAHPVTAGNPAIETMGVQAWAGVPVADPDGQVLGSFCVVDTEPHEWTERDRRVIQSLGRSAADEVARLRAVEEERVASASLAIARADVDVLLARQRALLELMQRSLLPRQLPACVGLDVAVRYQPTNSTTGLGGDWYDVIDLGGSRTAFVIADVSGHDAEAVAVMAQLRPSLHVFARSAASPSAVLAALHQLMLELDIPRFLTIFYGIWDGESATITYQCAGHPSPILRHADGHTELCDLGRSALLGVVGLDPTPDEHSLTLEPGASLVVFTDGLFERPTRLLDDGLLVLQQIIEAGPATSVEEMADHLVTQAEPPEGWFDDIALLVVRVQVA